MSSETLFGEHYRVTGEFKNLELTLGRIETVLDILGFEESSLGHVIHVAGTNGKGSTCSFIRDILEEQGYKTALFSSPHIETVRERIVLDYDLISVDDFDRIFSGIKDLCTEHNLSYFEALTVCALLYFAENSPDYTILETGLGGRFDATNIIENKTPVITTIAYDHAAYLGNTIFKIAWEKLAIVKKNSPVFVGANTGDVADLIRVKLRDKAIFIKPFSENERLPRPYDANLRLAEAVCSHLLKEDVLCEDPILPMCRMERIGNIILDGAHNPNGLLSLLTGMGPPPAVIVLSSTEERDILKMTAIAERYCRKVILTEIPDNERSVNLSKLPSGPYTLIPDCSKALNKAVEVAGNADILVSGSLYLCAAARKLLWENGI